MPWLAFFCCQLAVIAFPVTAASHTTPAHHPTLHMLSSVCVWESSDKFKLELNLQGIGSEGAAQWERGRSVLQAFAQSQGLSSIEVIGKSGMTLTRGRSGKVQRVIASRQKKPSR